LTSIHAPTATQTYPSRRKRCAHTENLLYESAESTGKHLNGG
jgi:hypothetical protein